MPAGHHSQSCVRPVTALPVQGTRAQRWLLWLAHLRGCLHLQGLDRLLQRLLGLADWKRGHLHRCRTSWGQPSRMWATPASREAVTFDGGSQGCLSLRATHCIPAAQKRDVLVRACSQQPCLNKASRVHQFEEPELDLATSIPVLLSSTQHTVLLAPPSMPSTTDMLSYRTSDPVQMSAKQSKRAMRGGSWDLCLTVSPLATQHSMMLAGQV